MHEFQHDGRKLTDAFGLIIFADESGRMNFVSSNLQGLFEMRLQIATNRTLRPTMAA